MHRLIVIALMMLAACGQTLALDTGPADSGHPLDGSVWEVATGRQIDPNALAAALDGPDVVILGEIHDNPIHHRRQAWLVDRIRPKGIAFEMVPEESEEGIAVFLDQGGAPAEIGPAIGWDRLGWPDWADYSPIFEAAQGAVITGGGVRRRDLRLAVQSGALLAYGPGAVRAGLAEPLSPADQAAQESEMIDAHCGHLPASAAPGMVEAQRLRDARFAAAVDRARQAGGGATVLITGNGHARSDRGVPLYLSNLIPEADVATLGQLEVVPGADALADYGTNQPYDYVWFAAPPDREDPCATFK